MGEREMRDALTMAAGGAHWERTYSDKTVDHEREQHSPSGRGMHSGHMPQQGPRRPRARGLIIYDASPTAIWTRPGSSDLSRCGA